MILTNSEKITAEWSEGKIHGAGVINRCTGEAEKGKWKYNIKQLNSQIIDENGNITKIYKDGQKYIGKMKDNKKEGYGTLYFDTGLICY